MSCLVKYRWVGLLSLMATLPLTVNAADVELRWVDGLNGSFGELDNWGNYGDGSVVPTAPTGNVVELAGRTLRVYNAGSIVRLGTGDTYSINYLYLNNNDRGANGSVVQFIQDGGSLTLTNTLQLGRESSEVGIGSAAAEYTISDGSLTGVKVLFGTGSANLFKVTGGTVTLSDRFQANASGNMNIDISGGSVSAKGLRFNDNNAVGNIEMTGGSLTFNGENSYLGNKENGKMTMVMSNDAEFFTTSGVGTMGFAQDKNTEYSLTMDDTSKISLASKTINIGAGEGAKATIVMNSTSRFEATDSSSKITFVDGKNSTVSLTLNDSASFVSAGTIGLGHHDPDNGGSSATVTVNDSALFQAQTIILGRGDNAQYSPVSVVNVNAGGTLAVGTIQVGGGTGSKTINVNGGTIQALSAGTLVTDTQYKNVKLVINAQAGGLTLDTQNFEVDLDHSVSGVGGLTKVGGGRLNLSGAGQTYTGKTTVKAGTLFVDASLASTSVVVESGATLLLEAANLSEGATLELLAGAELQMDFAGNQNLAGLTLAGNAVGVGTYTLDQLAALAGGGSVSFEDFGNGTTITVVPEPSTYALWAAAGLIGLVALRRRRR